MPQEPVDELRGTVIRNVQPDQGVIAVCQPPAGEISVQAEERRRREPVRHGNQVFVLGARDSHFHADDAKPKS